MNEPRYLFILGELRSVFTTSDEPTPEDLAHAEFGTALIIRLADQHYYGRAAAWEPIPVGVLGSAEIEGKRISPFHTPESYFVFQDNIKPKCNGNAGKFN